MACLCATDSADKTFSPYGGSLLREKAAHGLSGAKRAPNRASARHASLANSTVFKLKSGASCSQGSVVNRAHPSAVALSGGASRAVTMNCRADETRLFAHIHPSRTEVRPSLTARGSAQQAGSLSARCARLPKPAAMPNAASAISGSAPGAGTRPEPLFALPEPLLPPPDPLLPPPEPLLSEPEVSTRRPVMPLQKGCPPGR